MSSRGLRSLGRSGLRVSPLCLGAMNFGNEQFGCDEEASTSIIHAYLDAGHNFIDTANVYSGTKSETIVGKAGKGRRDSGGIATKAAAPRGPGGGWARRRGERGGGGAAGGAGAVRGGAEPQAPDEGLRGQPAAPGYGL